MGRKEREMLYRVAKFEGGLEVEVNRPLTVACQEEDERTIDKRVRDETRQLFK